MAWLAATSITVEPARLDMARCAGGGIPRTGMHAFRRGRISEWVYSGVKRQVIRDWAGHGSDKLIDLYTKKMWEYHSPEMSKVKPLLELDSNWTQAKREESGASAQRVVN